MGRSKTRGADILIETEKRGFKDMMNTMSSIYSKPEPTQDTLRVWWAKLEKYEFMQVSRAFDDWVNKNKYMPTVADIFEIIKASQPKDFVKALPRLTTEVELKSYHEKMKAIANEMASKPKTDPKAWARKIVNDYDKGKYKLEIGVKFAREALRQNKPSERITNDA
jgi:hypothetical protein